MASIQKLVDAMKLDVAKLIEEPLRVTCNGRRYFSLEHKLAVVQRCLAPGASVSAVALAHGFNTNLVRRWIQQYGDGASQPVRRGRLLPVIVEETGSPRPKAANSRDPVGPEAIRSLESDLIEIYLDGARVSLRASTESRLRVILEALMRSR